MDDNFGDDTVGSVLVIILRCETRKSDRNIDHLKWIFSDPYFIVYVCQIESYATDTQEDESIITLRYDTKLTDTESDKMLHTLIYASEGPYFRNEDNIDPKFWWKEMPVIIIKDSSVSNIYPGNGSTDNIPNTMRRMISMALDKAHDADLFFLCKWNDACDKYVDVDRNNDHKNGSTLKWSIQPTATQAIMYKPTSRDYVKDVLINLSTERSVDTKDKLNSTFSSILNNNIVDGRLTATVFVPNIIDYDINMSKSSEDYLKLNECAPIQTSTSTPSNASYVIWFVFMILLVIVVGWMLISMR